MSFCGCGVGGWGGVHSHFHVQPNYCVEVVLFCVVIEVVTLNKFRTGLKTIIHFDKLPRSFLLIYVFPGTLGN